MNKLIIIGNGFDKAHKIKTDYTDFKEYLDKNDLSLGDELEQYISPGILWSKFEEALGFLDDEQLKDDNMCYCLSYNDENWSDSAHHDYQYMISEALSFTEDIPIYFKEWIKSIEISYSPIFSNKIINNDCLFLSFNYTDTLEKIYNISRDNILYIHGKANSEDTLIVGHHDLDLIQNEELIFNSEEDRRLYYENISEDVRIIEGDSIIKAYFKETFKNTETIIEKNQKFFNSLSSIDEILIYGHSLSFIDLDYFEEINYRVKANCQWNISYYTPEDLQKAQSFVQSLELTNFNYIDAKTLCKK